MKRENFHWRAGGKLPNVEDHSKRKLKVISDYLHIYFDTVVRNPATDHLNITLVDGFCGGGGYQSDDGFIAGSPLVLLEAVKQAEERLNRSREKPLKINAEYVFIDENLNHIESLREQLLKHGYADLEPANISLVHQTFSEALPEVLSRISARQRKGRSIFILDQFGWSDVPMHAIQSIFQRLDRPEVILTFAIDSFLNYLTESSVQSELYTQFKIDERFVEEWQANKADEALGRLVSQRALMSNIHNNSGAKFFTPFLLWSQRENRWMMIAHLSNHQAARDKMLGVHWDSQNSFRHIGRGSLFSLGYDPRAIEDRESLFSFTEQDRIRLSEELTRELPEIIFTNMGSGTLAVSSLLDKIGNLTAGSNEDIFAVLKLMAESKELEVFRQDGCLKRPSTKISVSDRLIRPSQGTMFPLLVSKA